ncbi:MAG: acyl carrier protein [Pirellulales bacterium]|nr:acyl carrier protein [Pirellulales bacterium]
MPTESPLAHRGCLSRQEVLAEVKTIVQEFTDVPLENTQESSALEGDLGLDSLDIVEFAMEVEEHFGITIGDDAVEQSRTIGAVVDGVLRLLSDARASKPNSL